MLLLLAATPMPMPSCVFMPMLYGLPQEASSAEGQLVRLALTSRDCAALMPDGGPDAQARIKALEAELASLDSDVAEADAQHRLYSLLEERTRHALVAAVLCEVMSVLLCIACSIDVGLAEHTRVLSTSDWMKRSSSPVP